MNIKDLREIVDFLEQRGIAEFELDEDGRRIRIIRGQIVGPVAAAAPHQPVTASHAPVAAAPPAPVAAPPAPAPAEPPADQILVKSPIVGTFYRSPDPNAAPFVNVGDQRPGRARCSASSRP